MPGFSQAPPELPRLLARFLRAPATLVCEVSESRFYIGDAPDGRPTWGTVNPGRPVYQHFRWLTGSVW
jgi:hypothetical protein